jgi:hypothetical protein
LVKNEQLLSLDSNPVLQKPQRVGYNLGNFSSKSIKNQPNKVPCSLFNDRTYRYDKEVGDNMSNRLAGFNLFDQEATMKRSEKQALAR